MSGTQGGTRGTPGPGPVLDLDVPNILSLPGDCGLHGWGYPRLVPMVEHGLSPLLVAYLGYDTKPKPK